MSWFAKKVAIDIVRTVSRDDLVAVLKNWQENCFMSKIILPMTAVAELNKRIKKSAGEECKAKLDFSSCSLEDDHVVCLIQALAKTPVVSKLDLSKNDLSDNSALCIIRLLKGQVGLSFDLELDDIVDVPFLGEIVVPESGISPKLKNEITLLTSKLKLVNARGYIRNVHNRICEGGSMDAGLISKILREVTGKPPEKQTIANILMAGRNNNSYEHAYAELENICLRALSENGVVEILSQWREDELNILLGSNDDEEGLAEVDFVDEERVEICETPADFEGAYAADGADVNDEEIALEEEYYDEAAGEEYYEAEEEYVGEGYAEDAGEYAEGNEDEYTEATGDQYPEGEGDKYTETTGDYEESSHSETTGTNNRSSQFTSSSNQNSVAINDTSAATPSRASITRASYIANLLARVNTPNAENPPLIEPTRVETFETRVQIMTSSNARGAEAMRSPLFVPEPVVENSSSKHTTEFISIAPEVLVVSDSSLIHPVTEPIKTLARASGDKSPKRQSVSPQKASHRSRLDADDGETRVTLDKAVERGCLDLFSYELTHVNLLNFLPGHSLRSIRVLILRSNSISDLDGARFATLTPSLTELDIANNNLSGALPDDVLPTSLLKLDISQNNISDISAVVSCVNLRTLIAFNNLVKTIHGMPPALETIDLSDNLISTLGSLRAIASFSKLIQNLGIAGNPIFDSIDGLRVKLCSMLPQLRVLDGESLPGTKVRSQRIHLDEQEQSKPLTNDVNVPIKKLTRKEQSEADKRRMAKQISSNNSSRKQKVGPKLTVEATQSLLTRLTRPKAIPKPMPMFSDPLAFSKPSKPPRNLSTKPTVDISSAFPQSESQRKSMTPQEIEATKVIDRWLQKCYGEMGVAVTLLDDAFWICRQSTLDAALVNRFSASVNKISFVKERYKVPREVEEAGNIINEIGDNERRSAISAMISNLSALSSVLTDIDSAITFFSSLSLSVADLRTGVIVSMKKPEGVFVCEHLLGEFGVEYNLCDFVEEVPVSEPQESETDRTLIETSQSQIATTAPSKLSSEEMGQYMGNLKLRLTAKAKLLVNKKSRTDLIEESQLYSQSISKPVPRDSTSSTDFFELNNVSGTETPALIASSTQASEIAPAIEETLPSVGPIPSNHELQSKETVVSLTSDASMKPVPLSVPTPSPAELLRERLLNRRAVRDTEAIEVSRESSETHHVLPHTFSEASETESASIAEVDADSIDINKLSMKERLKARMKK